ncbi:ATP-binding protein [Pannus brasiliensis CCIBt3594]|uniref:ATP-binding protein n=1 Tax=Pannus brasiliensis CCIBt3594 TaxID=1427578 RepID=A0AAW9QRC0_9CHRO
MLIEIQYKVASLLVYQGVFQNPIGRAFTEFIEGGSVPEALKAYGKWFTALADKNQSWSDFLIEQIVLDDNPFSRQVQTAELTDISPSLLLATKHDLSILQELYRLTPAHFIQGITVEGENTIELPDWQVENRSDSFLHSSENWTESLDRLASYYREKGTGIFAQYRAFRWREGTLQGIPSPDPIDIAEIVGYDSPKEMLLKNTEFLLSGYPALNVLLYGSRGSGKSSLVKGLLQKYSERGLRLIEVAKSELKDLPIIVDRLRDLPRKFIIFVDDLSFEEDDEAFKALKVVLEGSVTARPRNVVVYATSNRRHLVREFFGDRPRPIEGEELHTWDTVQEKLSFSDRFGLTLTFEPADQEKYLAIIHHLAGLAGLEIEREDLEFRAKQWATRHNGRSGRTARQFIDFLTGEARGSR